MFAVSDAALVIGSVSAATATVLAATLPVLIRTSRHARGAYDAVNRADAVLEPGGVDSRTPNLRQLVVRGFEESRADSMVLHERLGEVRSEAAAAHDAAREAFARVDEHARDEKAHPWLEPVTFPEREARLRGTAERG